MNILIISMGIIIIGLLLSLLKFGKHSNLPLGIAGYVQCNPIYDSGNKSQRTKKHNMIRISRLRRKKS